jgi:hypothetical protein
VLVFFNILQRLRITKKNSGFPFWKACFCGEILIVEKFLQNAPEVVDTGKIGC